MAVAAPSGAARPSAAPSTPQDSNADAVARWRAAVAARPGDALALSNLGAALRQAGALDEALAALQRAVALAPTSDEAHTNLGNVLKALGRIEEALAAYRRAMELNPANEHAQVNLGHLLSDFGCHAEAAALYANALAVAPDCDEARFSLALSHLLKGELAEGWPLYEARWHRGIQRPRDLQVPAWQGEDLAGRRILLYAEQGLGDSLQFLRYLPLVLARGAAPVVEVQAPLLPLVRSSFPEVACLAAGAALPELDLACPLMTLPLRFGTTLETIPAEGPYLAPEPARVAAWAERLAPDGRPRVGLAWAGNPNNPNDRNRSLPFAALDPLLALEPLRWVSLQVPARPEAQSCDRLLDVSGALGDFAETAAAIANLELVISADTAIAHLAGALGKPVWLLLPFSPDWRWLLERSDSPWYPTASLFRQPLPGDWPSVVAQVVAELQAALGGGR